MKKIILLSLISFLFLSCKSVPAPQSLMGSWERVVNREEPSNKKYREFATFLSPDIITITQVVDDHRISHSGTFIVNDDELEVDINDKEYEGSYVIKNGVLTITGKEKVYTYRKVKEDKKQRKYSSYGKNHALSYESTQLSNTTPHSKDRV